MNPFVQLERRLVAKGIVTRTGGDPSGLRGEAIEPGPGPSGQDLPNESLSATNQQTNTTNEPLKLSRFYAHTFSEASGSMHVQIARKGITFCAVVHDGFEGEDGTQFFKVVSLLGTGWVRGANVRQCSGIDGRCVCAGERGQDKGEPASLSPARAVPLGNTGTTVVEGEGGQ